MWIKEKIKEFLNDPQINIFLFIAGAVTLILYCLWKYLIPVFTSVILAYILEGLIKPLEKLKIPRNVGLFLVFFLFMTSVVFLIIWIIPIAIKEFTQFIQDLPSMFLAWKMHLQNFLKKYPALINKLQIDSAIGFLVNEVRGLGKHALSYSIASIVSIFNFLVYLVMVPLITFFFLKDKDSIIQFLKKLLPSNIEFTSQVWKEVNNKIAKFLQGKMWEIVIVWVASYLFFIIIKLKFALLLSLLIGLSVLIPFVGAIAMTIPVAMVAYFQWGFSNKLLITIIGYSIIQFLDGNVLVPILMSGFVNIHPVAIMIAVILFGNLWGLWGVFFAIPLLSLIHTVIKTWPRKNIMEEKINEG